MVSLDPRAKVSTNGAETKIPSVNTYLPLILHNKEAGLDELLLINKMGSSTSSFRSFQTIIIQFTPRSGDLRKNFVSLPIRTGVTGTKKWLVYLKLTPGSLKMNTRTVTPNF